MQKQTTSLNIKAFLDMVVECQKAYDCAYKMVGLKDKEAQDFLHQLELGSYDQRGKTATRLANSRRERRRYKDIVTVLQPLIDWAKTPEASKALNTLRSNALGETRKAEKSIEDRVYYPRVITDLEIASIIEEKKE